MTLFYESSGAMWKEIVAAEAHIEKALKGTDEMIARYHGEHYRGGGGQAMVTANHAYEWLSIISAQILNSNPRAYTRARRPDVGQQQAIAFRHALNRWCVDTDLVELLRKMFVDWAFRRSVGVMSRVQMNDSGPLNGPRFMPKWGRISRKNFLYDVLVEDWNETRWRGHRWVMDFGALNTLAEKTRGFRPDVVRKLRTNSNVEGLRPEGVRNPGSLDREDIVLYQTWVPEEEVEGSPGEDAGFYGTTHLYAWAAPDEDSKKGYSALRRIKNGDGQLEEIADPQPYFGRRQGMYVMNGQDYVPDQVEPLSQFVALEGFLLSMNVRGQVMQSAMEDYAKMIFVNAKDPSLPGKIKSGGHHCVIPVKALTKDDVIAVEKGGLTDQMVKQWMLEKERLDRLSGITDTMRGSVGGGDTTATEQMLAQGGSTARLAKYRNSWYYHVGQMMRGAAEAMFLDDDFAVRLPDEAAQEMNMRSPVLYGGKRPGETFEDLEIDIEPLSMEFMSEQRSLQYATQMADIYMQTAPMIVQYPFLDWKAILADIGDAMSSPQMAERVDFELADMYSGLMLGQQLASASSGGSAQPSPTPTMSKNVPEARPAQAPAAPSTPAGQAKSSAASGGGKAFGQAKKAVGVK